MEVYVLETGFSFFLFFKVLTHKLHLKLQNQCCVHTVYHSFYSL